MMFNFSQSSITSKRPSTPRLPLGWHKEAKELVGGELNP